MNILFQLFGIYKKKIELEDLSVFKRHLELIPEELESA